VTTPSTYWSKTIWTQQTTIGNGHVSATQAETIVNGHISAIGAKKIVKGHVSASQAEKDADTLLPAPKSPAKKNQKNT
jgi:hypothetical protein